ncbi:ATP-binding protein [Myxococcota bacterium]|nr:ATP-binding protein [Myxococcota bacterium]
MEQRSIGLRQDLLRNDDSIIQNLNTAVLVVDLDGRIMSTNPPAEQILGESPAQLLGEPVARWLASSGEALVRSTLERGERFRAVESFLTLGDGARLPIGISWAPLMDADGQRYGAVATFQDLTGIKQLQNQVLQTEKLASIGQLAAGVAHEVNNPMGFIHANLFQMAEYVSDLRRVWEGVEALRKAAAQVDSEELRSVGAQLTALAEEADVDFVLSDLGKAIRESQEGSERIRHIVQDLRDFSHQDSGQRGMADVNQCVDSTASIVWPMMKHLVVLEKEYGEIPLVPGYAMQLKQVFMNLLVNAYQAIEERVGDTAETGTVRLTTRSDETGVFVTVEDTGTGIPEDRVSRIFDPFFTTKSVGNGTGLGLSTCYSIVQRHGGRIDVESTVGEGSTFQLWLPLEGSGDDD